MAPTPRVLIVIVIAIAIISTAIIVYENRETTHEDTMIVEGKGPYAANRAFGKHTYDTEYVYFRGHWYIHFRPDGGFVHDPDCPDCKYPEEDLIGR